MKKIFVVLVCLSILLGSCIPPTQTETPTPQADPLNTPWDDRSIFKSGLVEAEQKVLEGLDGASVYHIELAITEDLYHVSGHQEVQYTYTETAPLDRIEFRLFPNILGGKMEVTNLVAGGQSVTPEYDLKNSLLVLPLPAPLATGEKIVLGSVGTRPVVSLSMRISAPGGMLSTPMLPLPRRSGLKAGSVDTPVCRTLSSARELRGEAACRLGAYIAGARRIAGGALVFLCACAAALAPVPAGSEEYLLGEGDILQISVFGHADLTTTVRVPPEGSVRCPAHRLHRRRRPHGGTARGRHHRGPGRRLHRRSPGHGRGAGVPNEAGRHRRPGQPSGAIRFPRAPDLPRAALAGRRAGGRCRRPGLRAAPGAFVVGPFSIRAEAAYFADRPYLRPAQDVIDAALAGADIVTVQNSIARNGFRRVALEPLFVDLDAVEWGIGADMSWEGFRPLVQLAQVVPTESAPRLLIGDPDTRLIAQVRKPVWRERVEFEVRTVYAIEAGGWFALPRVTWVPRDDVRLRLGYLAIGGLADSLIGQFEANDEVVLDVRWTF